MRIVSSLSRWGIPQEPGLQPWLHNKTLSQQPKKQPTKQQRQKTGLTMLYIQGDIF